MGGPMLLGVRADAASGIGRGQRSSAAPFKQGAAVAMYLGAGGRAGRQGQTYSVSCTLCAQIRHAH